MIVIDGKEVRINRENAVVSEADATYCDLCDYIIKNGVRTHNRTGIDTIAIANWQHIFDLSKGFPIMETKKVNAKNFASEIQWIHQEQSNKVQWLKDRDNPVWNQWVVDEDGIYRTYEQGNKAINEPDREVPLHIQKFNETTGEIDKIPVRQEMNKKTGQEERIPVIFKLREVKCLIKNSNNSPVEIDGITIPVEDQEKFNKTLEKAEKEKYDLSIPSNLLNLIKVLPESIYNVVKPTMVKPFTEADEKGNPLTIREAIYFGKEYAGTIGEAYGFITNKYKMPQCVEYRLKHNPTDRRMIINLWQNAHLEKAVLPSCVFLDIFKTTPDGKLHSNVTQRSADVPLGVPFNFAQYALLHNMFAKANGYKVGTMAWNIQDTHIYENQLDGIKKQLQRYKYMLYFSNYIQNHTDEEIEEKYNEVERKYNLVNNKAFRLLQLSRSTTDNPMTREEFDKIPMSKRYNLLKEMDEKTIGTLNMDFSKIYENMFERKTCFEHILTRETPVLELAEHDSFFDYSTEYVKKNDPYLNENPIGNKELVLKNYHPTPFISMPIAQ